MGAVKNKGKNKGHDNLIPCKKGEVRNPNGRPKGSRDFKTIYREALIKLAQTEKLDPDSLEVDIVKNALNKAKGGDIRFYQDTMDRIHGKAVQPVGNDKGVPFVIQIVKYTDADDTDTTQLP